MYIEMNLLHSVLWGYSLYFIFFTIYVEVNPGLTNIWYRVASDGMKHINLSSYWNFITSPFTEIQFWYPENWDMNYFLGATVTTGLLYYFL
jgi:hypothetical protein